ncbi:MAG: class I SAM-dependent methyltransferase [Myxococcales bacterium]|nr:class I SAM-dependent methyltransferase [Myxococcales bacterium]
MTIGELEGLCARRAARFPDFDAADVLRDDGQLLVVAKPAGVPCQAPDPSSRDDLPHRLGRWLAARGEAPYLGVHQRLDRDTSGVIAYARTDEANRYLAEQMEGRRAEKTYVAAVTGWRGGARTLRHRLAKGAHGVEVVRAPAGKEAVSHVEVLERHGERALLRVRIDTGRTHQIRVQLAAEGAPVAGDSLYGGAPAPRLMLHAASVRFDRPSPGSASPTPPTFEAPVPAAFTRWLTHADGPFAAPTHPGALADALREALERRWGLARAACAEEPTTAFRLVNAEGDGVAGLTVDLYGDHLVASLYDAAIDHEESLLDALEALGFEGIYLKRRPKQANVIVDPRRQEVAPAAPVRGRAAPAELIVWEHGVRYPVRLGDGLSTGLFLDMREPRRRVREAASGRRVLNLFAYTGPFSVAAAAGGATEVLTVDVAAPALARAEEAFALNGLEGQRTYRADCFDFLARGVARGERFDMVICDPPTYATTKRTRWTSGKQWVELAERCLRVAAPGAIVLLSSNDHRMSAEQFRRYAREAAERVGVTPSVLRTLPAPWDYPATPGAPPAFKRLWIEL